MEPAASSPSQQPAVVRAYVGLGSNLDDPRRQIEAALSELDTLPHSRCVARSALYRSAPLDGTDQPDYLNAVAAVDTSLSAPDLLEALLALERRHGRVRGAGRWSARTLDLDILLYGDVVVDRPGLRLPHPGLPQRHFVLYPLAEIAAGLEIPGYGSLAALLKQCPDSGLTRLTDNER